MFIHACALGAAPTTLERIVWFPIQGACCPTGASRHPLSPDEYCRDSRTALAEQNAIIGGETTEWPKPRAQLSSKLACVSPGVHAARRCVAGSSFIPISCSS
jgi:hypothetical protein